MTPTVGDMTEALVSPYHFNPTQENFIIRTVDNVEFHIDRSIIANASPVFANMLSRSPTPSDGQRPMVDVTEHSSVWYFLLNYCHLRLVDEPLLQLGTICALLGAADKYRMWAVRMWLERTLRRPEYLDPHAALRTYAIACAYGIPAVARLAARHSLSRPAEHGGLVEELKLISALQYARLLDYRDQCVAAAVNAVSGFFTSASWLEEHSTLLGGCYDCRWSIERTVAVVKVRDEVGHSVHVPVRFEWLEYRKNLETQLKVCPDPSVARRSVLLDPAIRAAAKCEVCGEGILAKTYAFSHDVEATIDKAIAVVRTVSTHVDTLIYTSNVGTNARLSQVQLQAL